MHWSNVFLALTHRYINTTRFPLVTDLNMFLVIKGHYSKWSTWPHDISQHFELGEGTHISQLFNQLLIQAQIKETSKLCVTGLCEGNSPVTGELPTQRVSNMENPFHYFITRTVNFCRNLPYGNTITWSWWRHELQMLSTLLPLSRGIHWSPMDSPQIEPVMHSFDHFYVFILNKLLKKEFLVIWDAWCLCDINVIMIERSWWWHGNATGALWGEFTGHWWNPFTKGQ